MAPPPRAATIVPMQSTFTTEALAERLFGAAVATFDLAGVYLGDRLGLYRALADGGPATPAELAAHAGIDTRYAREWLEQQAVGGILEADGEPHGDARRYALPDAHRAVLVDRTDLSYLAPLARGLTAAMGALPALLDAYRSGDGLGWEAYGADMREAQADLNRPAVTQLLGTAWLPAIADLDARLRADPPARIADVACGEGWSTLALARAYPNARVVGIDLDEASIAAARLHATAEGLADRVEFRHADAAGLDGTFDAALVIEAVHDMSQPVAVLRGIREALADDGSLIVIDERVAERFAAPGDDVERFMYGWSLLVCLPDGRSRQPSAATGTVMRPDTLRHYADEAGFASVEVLPIDHETFRFYRLRPG